jgi:phosphoglycerate dehydrogenase-like enzyme
VKEVVLVTEPEFVKADKVFRSEADFEVRSAPVEEAGLAEAVRTAASRAVIIGTTPYVGPLYEALGERAGGRGGIMARFGVGHDGVDKAKARSRGIVVTNTPGVLDTSVAEMVLSLMLALVRRVPQRDAAVKTARWEPGPGVELAGKALAIIGLGAIGRRVARATHFGLGMRVLAADVLPPTELEAAEGKRMDQVRAAFGLALYSTDVDAVITQADVVSLHIPGRPATDGFMGSERLSLMRPGAILVNTSRGSVVDEAALYDALAGGRLGGAALDVLAEEPYRPADPAKDLRTLPNVILTPHVASNTFEANERMARTALENVRRFFTGRMDGLTRVDA